MQKGVVKKTSGPTASWLRYMGHVFFIVLLHCVRLKSEDNIAHNMLWGKGSFKHFVQKLLHLEFSTSAECCAAQCAAKALGKERSRSYQTSEPQGAPWSPRPHEPSCFQHNCPQM